MKKLLALLLSLAMLLALCACGGDSGSGGGTQPDPAPSGTSVGQAKDDPVQTQPIDAGATHLSYEDLTETENFWLWLDEGDIQLQIDYPFGFRFDGHGNGMGSESSWYFAIVMTHSEQPMPDTSLEDAFYTLLNGEDGFHSILRMVNKADYDDVTPETEVVTLDSGREAIHFSGTQHMDDYGTIADCPIWGYCTLLDDIPVIVCYVIFDEEGLESDRLEESARYCSPEDMEHYVTEMINTVRIVEE